MFQLAISLKHFHIFIYNMKEKVTNVISSSVYTALYALSILHECFCNFHPEQSYANGNPETYFPRDVLLRTQTHKIFNIGSVSTFSTMKKWSKRARGEVRIISWKIGAGILGKTGLTIIFIR